MDELVAADTGPLIALGLVNALEALARLRDGARTRLRPLFDRLAAGGYYLSQALIEAALAQVGEDDKSAVRTT